MPIIPDLPVCGQPAAHRIEIYSPTGDMAHGSLDGSVYVCAGHLDPVIGTLLAARFVPYVVPDTQPGPKRCGDGMNFTGTTTVVLTAPAPAVPGHPGWCDPARCESSLGVDGAHTSRPSVVRPDEQSTVRLQWRLWQRADQPVYVELAVGDHRDGHRARVDLSLAQAMQARHVLGQLVNAARGAR